MIDRWRYQLIFRRPSKQPLDSFHPVIVDAPAKRLLMTIFRMFVTMDHELADSLELQRPEICRRRCTIEMIDRAQRVAVLTDFASLGSVGLAVMHLRPGPKRLDDFHHRELDSCYQSPTVGEPFGDDAVIFGSRCLGPVRAKVNVLAAQGDDSLT